MGLHREGNITIAIIVSLALIGSFATYWSESPLWFVLSSLFFIVLLFAVWFFRDPKRPVSDPDENRVLSPADGKVVVIEEVEDPEVAVGKRTQISIFMSPLDVHVNRVPISGEITYYKYHKGKYLVAWHPKSSTENERATFVLRSAHGDIIIRQIAGAVARRIESYPSTGDTVRQGDELGFIKFGSRCDIFLPPGADIKVAIGDHVKGNIDTIASYA